MAFGLIKNEIFVQNGMRLRYGMGYNLWSILPFQFFSLCMIYMLLQEKKVKIYKVILMCIVAIYIGVMTDTKTSVFATLLCTFLLYCIQSKKFINWNHLNWMVGIPIILVIISLFATYAYATEIPIFVKIDKILNHRLMYQAIGLNEYGVHLLSNPEVQYIVIGNDYFALDNLYINLLVKWGIVATVIFLLIFSYLIKYCINVRNIKLLCIVTFMCLMAIVWSRLLVFIEAEFLVCFGEVFSKRYEQRKI